jgi:membrane-associated phospholipid phosphatase
MRFAASIVIGVLVMSRASAAVADGQASQQSAATAERRSPAYRLSVDIDLPLLLIPAAVSASWFLSTELTPPHCSPRCDPDTLNIFDRPAAGLYSAEWQVAADAGTVGVLSAMPLLLALGEGPLHAANDVVVVAQATMLASATQVAMSFATSRPRPRLYGDGAPHDQRDDGNAARSFFSGHTATCVAATIATFRTLQRVNRPTLAWAALGVGLFGSSFLSVGRVAAGSHFPTDVAAGAAVGVGYGLLLPALHAAPPEVARAARGLHVRARFVPVFNEGFGGGNLLGTF